MGAQRKGWIRLRGLQIDGVRVGVYAHERQVPRPIRVDVGVWVQVARAAATDHLDDAFDYDRLAERIAEISRSRHFNLIETLAETLSKQLLQDPEIDRVALSIHKTGVRGGAEASVEIERWRDEIAEREP